jgi:hypothetical protein
MLRINETGTPANFYVKLGYVSSGVSGRETAAAEWDAV